MTRVTRSAFVACGALALAWGSAAHAGFEELGVDLGDRVDRIVRWNGSFRIRSDLFYDLDLDRGPTPSGQLLFPVPLSDPNGQCLTNVDMRLRSDLTFVAPKGGLAAHLRLDLFDGMALGSAPSGPPSAATGQSPDSAILRVKRGWAEVLTPLGVLAAGRMGSQWGMGMLTNGGDEFDSDSGDAADRIAFSTPLAGLIWSAAYDFTAIGPSVARRGGTGTVDVDPADNVSTITFAVLRYHDALAHRRRLKAGKATLDGGVYLSYRWQDKDVPASYAPVAVSSSREGPARADGPAAGLPASPPLTASQAVARGFAATAIDGWVRLTHPLFELEAEGVYLHAGYDQASLVPGVSLRAKVSADPWGFAVKSRFGDGEDGPSGGLDLGLASGDPAFGFGVVQPLGARAPVRGDLDGPQVRIPSDTHFSNLRFHPDFRIDQILFRELIGTVTDAFYLRPHGRWVVPNVLAGALQLDLVLVASWAMEATSTPGQKAPLGVELDPSVAYMSEDGFRVELAYAVLFPLAGLDNPELGLGAQPGQLWRIRLGYTF